jgi:hypothetical protein
MGNGARSCEEEGFVFGFCAEILSTRLRGATPRGAYTNLLYKAPGLAQLAMPEMNEGNEFYLISRSQATHSKS